MQNNHRLEPYEVRNVAEKVLEGVDQGKTISQISHEMPDISSSTIYNIAKKLEEAGLIEEDNKNW